jgi:hypothetical protein
MKKQGNMIPPKVHNCVLTKGKDTEMEEMSKNSKVYF